MFVIFQINCFVKKSFRFFRGLLAQETSSEFQPLPGIDIFPCSQISKAGYAENNLENRSRPVNQGRGFI